MIEFNGIKCHLINFFEKLRVMTIDPNKPTHHWVDIKKKKKKY